MTGKTLAKIFEVDADEADMSVAEYELRKGRCYELAIWETSVLHNTDPQVLEHKDDLVIVHGRPRLTQPPYQRYGHAWLEWEEDGLVYCYDVVKRRKIFWLIYYGCGQIKEKEVFKYTVEDARRMCLDYRHHGPWEGKEGCPPIRE